MSPRCTCLTWCKMELRYSQLVWTVSASNKINKSKWHGPHQEDRVNALNISWLIMTMIHTGFNILRHDTQSGQRFTLVFSWSAMSHRLQHRLHYTRFEIQFKRDNLLSFCTSHANRLKQSCAFFHKCYSVHRQFHDIFCCVLDDASE